MRAVRRLIVYSREWRGDVYGLYKAMSVLLQRHRTYVVEKVLELSPSRVLVFTFPCGWHGDVLFLAPYVVAVGPFDHDDLVDKIAAMPDRVALTVLEGEWSMEDVFTEFGPFDVGVACQGPPTPEVRRYVWKLVVAKIGGPLGQVLEAVYKPSEVEADVQLKID
ncbi:MAG: hypothetical protein ABWK05_05905 [Pyrobaculum sp.]